jgi:hypothetical protein
LSSNLISFGVPISTIVAIRIYLHLEIKLVIPVILKEALGWLGWGYVMMAYSIKDLLFFLFYSNHVVYRMGGTYGCTGCGRSCSPRCTCPEMPLVRSTGFVKHRLRHFLFFDVIATPPDRTYSMCCGM